MQVRGQPPVSLLTFYLPSGGVISLLLLAAVYIRLAGPQASGVSPVSVLCLAIGTGIAGIVGTDLLLAFHGSSFSYSMYTAH